MSARAWGWRHGGRKRYAVRGLDLSVAPGERVLLLGPSGAGKSTLLHGLAGVLGQDEEGEQEGGLLLDGLPPADARGRAGLVLQDPESQVVLARVGDDVAFGCENLAVPREHIWPRVEWALRTVGLDLPLDHPSSALSGGQKQRLALAGVLAMRPGLLLLDEPTANLDPEGVELVRDSVRSVADELGLTLVVVEHRVAVWEDVVDRVVVLGAPEEDRTPVIADGAPARVLRGGGTGPSDAGRAREQLHAAGVWLPGRPPALPVSTRHTGSGGGEPLLGATELAVARTPRGPVAAADLNVQVRAGRCLAVVGPNGSGKSTLALTLAGLLPARRGRVTAEPALARGAGADPWRWRGRELAQRIGVVFQEPEQQLLTGTVAEEVAFGPQRTGVADDEVEARVEELLERLRLSRLARAHPFTLSGGEKRRLSVATVLATRPPVLVLDEPTFGQDARTWAELVAMLRDLRDDGRAVVVVTHDRPLVEALADEVLTLEAPC
ncbi:MAG TPA: ABC transporter ATP-binding protein [Segeticoccus sp.]|nr:ABC transporter ATP-binding protein [Segeticoccus sp.]